MRKPLMWVGADTGRGRYDSAGAWSVLDWAPPFGIGRHWSEDANWTRSPGRVLESVRGKTGAGWCPFLLTPTQKVVVLRGRGTFHD